MMVALTLAAKMPSTIWSDMSCFTSRSCLDKLPAVQRRHMMFFLWQAVTSSCARVRVSSSASRVQAVVGCSIISVSWSRVRRALTLTTRFLISQHSSLFFRALSTASLIMSATLTILSTLANGSAILSFSKLAELRCWLFCLPSDHLALPPSLYQATGRKPLVEEVWAMTHLSILYRKFPTPS
uniref:Uncharacterized protein n=1 Tax=Arundo donax TaxID=35708 RepID=A0A0A8ZGF0_ARUDO